MDIRGKFHYVGINSVKDGATEIASIKKRTKVSRLVQLVLQSRLIRATARMGFAATGR